MTRKQDKIVTLKLAYGDLLELDTYAERSGVSRSEFIKQAINEKIAGKTKQDVQDEKFNDLEKVAMATIETSKSVGGLDEKVGDTLYGVVQLQDAFIALFPDKAKQLNILFGRGK